MVPYTYNKPQVDLLYKLIAESNPGAVFPISPENAVIGKPEAIVVEPGKIANTRIPIAGKGVYVASARVNYRRINLQDFFKGINVTFNDWSPSGNSGPGYVTAQVVIDYFNRTYGLALTVNDIVSPGGIWATGASSTAIAGTSLCYAGSLSWTWSQGKRELDTVFTANNVDGRLFPGGNVFGGSRKPQGEYVAYGLDFNPVKATFIASFPASWPAWTSSGTWPDPLFDFLKANVSPLFSRSKQHTEVGGFEGAPGIHVTIPSALLPEANSAKYNRAVAVTALPGSWWQGKIIFHYNA